MTTETLTDEPMQDMYGQDVAYGDHVWLYTKNGYKMVATITGHRASAGKTAVLVDGDPYSICQRLANVQKMDSEEAGKHGMPIHGSGYSDEEKVSSSEGRGMATSFKELRRLAKKAGVDGWVDMTREELEMAVGTQEEGEQVVATKTKKLKKVAKAEGSENGSAKKVKAAPKARTPREVDPNNPFRAGTNQYLITEELKRGGTRDQLVERLRDKLEFNFYRTGRTDEDYLTGAIKHRIMVTAKTLKNDYGWEVMKDGDKVQASPA